MGKKPEIIYEDNHIIVVEKPPNLLTQGDRTGDENLLDILKEDLKVRYNKPGNVYLGLVHRLDRPVGGVMVFAKTSKAASRLSGQIREGKFGKSYIAVVHGTPRQPSGTLEHYLVKDDRTNTVKVVGPQERAGIKTASVPDKAKKASLDYMVKETRENLSLVRIKLHTGRPHQIRVQLAATGNPLYGDQKYGADLNKPGMQLALWSAEISFTHPVSKEPVLFVSIPPDKYPWNLFSLYA
ncbi:MAG: RluA family pseudouridine synthase [Bacillota bacterium]